MAELPGLSGWTQALYGTATSQGWQYWLQLGVNVILGTLIGGLVLIAILKAVSKAFGESVNIANAFALVLIVNIINLFGVIGFLSAPLPAVAFIIPLLLWLGLTRLFFSGLRLPHVLVVAVAGYVVSILLVPALTATVAGFIPLPK